MLFLGMANAYVMRTNMSVAIVAMVNHTALPLDDSVRDDECDSDNSSMSWVKEMSHASKVSNYSIISKLQSSVTVILLCTVTEAR